MTSRFPLAPMDALLRVFTGIALAVPVVIGVSAATAPSPIRTAMFATVAIVAAIYVFVWVYLRPTGFVVSPGGLELVWPVRRRRVPASAILRARVLDRAQLRAELGRIMRIGAGGLGGGFGLARTSRGLVELWVSRVDWMVYVECEGCRSLLLTPADPERFVAALPVR